MKIVSYKKKKRSFAIFSYYQVSNIALKIIGNVYLMLLKLNSLLSEYISGVLYIMYTTLLL